MLQLESFGTGMLKQSKLIALGTSALLTASIVDIVRHEVSGGMELLAIDIDTSTVGTKSNAIGLEIETKFLFFATVNASLDCPVVL